MGETETGGAGSPEAPIGVFDSGIGGLTVLREIVLALPEEDTVYLGDTARVPYGSKSRATVERYAREVASFLASHGVKMLVVACNTASAYALDALDDALGIPVVGVVEPGAGRAAALTVNSRVGIIGTEGTIRSNAYTRAIERIAPGIECFAKACPLFVPLAEEGLTQGDIATLVAARYLSELKDSEIDTLVLGCTHYPLLKKAIASVMGPGVGLIDSAEATASEVKSVLTGSGLLRGPRDDAAGRRFFVTDSPERFVAIGKGFFGDGLDTAELAVLDRLPAVCAQG